MSFGLLLIPSLVFAIGDSTDASGVRRSSRDKSAYVGPSGAIDDHEWRYETTSGDVAVRRQTRRNDRAHDFEGDGDSTLDKEMIAYKTLVRTQNESPVGVKKQRTSANSPLRASVPEHTENLVSLQVEQFPEPIYEAETGRHIFRLSRMEVRAVTSTIVISCLAGALLITIVCWWASSHGWFSTISADSSDYQEMTELEETVSKNAAVSVKSAGRISVLSSPYYFLNQTVAMVRHGDRLDHTFEWEAHPHSKRWPNDTPLSEEGHEHARAVGQSFKESGKPFGMIISSPYLRCAQTAGRIAQVLAIPVHFDLDMGEVFDDVSMVGDCTGIPQHKSAEELAEHLKPDFPDVEWVRDDSGQIKIEGMLQDFPESFDAARMRYCYKVKKLLQKAAAELLSVIIVTHGDALGAVVGLMNEDLLIRNIPYAAYAIASREVKVLKKGGGQILEE
jgi:broad specificity phosphatase PhoE